MTLETFAARVEDVHGRIARACERASRSPDEVTLIAVSKSWPTASVCTAWQAGLRHFGENRVQEGVAKVEALESLGIRPTWHLIGHLQTNKARAAVKAFVILHSVDSERLLQAIALTGSPTRIMIEVNVAQEASKYGVAPELLPALLAAAAEIDLVKVEGLMTVAPRVDDPEDVRSIFRTLRELALRNDLPSLSMGMTDDFEVAIEEGATHIRVGRAIFGERNV
jgi:PLP dependent protein